MKKPRTINDLLDEFKFHPERHEISREAVVRRAKMLGTHYERQSAVKTRSPWHNKVLEKWGPELK